MPISTIFQDLREIEKDTFNYELDSLSLDCFLRVLYTCCMEDHYEGAYLEPLLEDYILPDTYLMFYELIMDHLLDSPDHTFYMDVPSLTDLTHREVITMQIVKLGVSSYNLKLNCLTTEHV